jgi:hypothetical protein
MTAAIAEKNQTPIHSKNYGTWIPAERWQAHRAAHSRFMPFDHSSEFLFAPCVREWIVQGARVGGAVRMIEGAGPAGWSVQFDFGAEFLLPFDGCKVKAYFDPCAAVECAATIVLAENVRNHRIGEVLGVAPQINEVARYARRALGYFEDPDRGLEHRIKTAAALRREVRSILPNGKTQAASSEARDGLGNAPSKCVTDAALRFLQPTAEEDKVVLLAEDNLRLRAAIEAHRECIHGADYNYDEDESYRPEAELYRALKSPRSSGRKISNPKSQIRNSK